MLKKPNALQRFWEKQAERKEILSPLEKLEGEVIFTRVLLFLCSVLLVRFIVEYWDFYRLVLDFFESVNRYCKMNDEFLKEEVQLLERISEALERLLH